MSVAVKRNYRFYLKFTKWWFKNGGRRIHYKAFLFTSFSTEDYNSLNNHIGFFDGIFDSVPKLLCIITISLAAVLGGFQSGCSKEISLDQSNAENILLNFSDETLIKRYKQSYSFVSITVIKKEIYLIANYEEIFKFESSTGKLSKMKTFFGAGVAYKFVPTGLFYSKKTNNLYVANYTANNILIFTVDLIGNRLIFKHEIKSKNTIGPENIFVSNTGQYLAVANYDGGTVGLFERKNGAYVELWNQNILQVHGVCILHDKVYATGLASRKIYKMDIATGVIEQSVGRLHSNPEKNGFMWPTCIYPLGEDRLVVSDAHTGYIYVLNSDTLAIHEYFGGNGPTFKYLHMPYAVIVDKTDFYILSTFQDRIIKGNINKWNVDKNYYFKEKNWNAVSIDNPRDIENNLNGYGTYIYKKGPNIKILDQVYHLGFGHLYPLKEKNPVIRFPNVATLNNNNSYIYFTDAISISNTEKIIVSDVSMIGFYVYNKSNGLQYTIPFRMNTTDNWVIDNKIVSSSGITNVAEIVRLMRDKTKEIDMIRRENGLLDYKDYWQILYSGSNTLLNYSEKLFAEKLQSLFKSKEGLSFFYNYKRLLRDKGSTREDVEDLANTFYSCFLKNTYSDYNELISVQMLTEASIKKR